MKIDLESLEVLEERLRTELRGAWLGRRYYHFSGYEYGSGNAISENDPVKKARIFQAIRTPLAGLRAIQLARRTVAAVDELKAKYGVKVSK